MINILSEDVKTFCKLTSKKIRESAFDKNIKKLDEILPAYDMFWRLVILAIIVRRSRECSKFIDHYLRTHRQICDNVIKNLCGTNRPILIGEVKKTREEWNTATEYLMRRMEKGK